MLFQNGKKITSKLKKGLMTGAVLAAGCLSVLAFAGQDTPLVKLTETKPITASAYDIYVTVIADTEDGQNKQLQTGKWYVSPNRRYVAIMQGDGNLVVYRHNPDTNKAYDPQWSTRTDHNSGAKCIMQADGNLVIYSSSMKALWHSKSHGKRNAYLGLADDGELYVYSRDAGYDTWSNGYHGNTYYQEPVSTQPPRTTAVQENTPITAGTQPGTYTVPTTTVETVYRFEKASSKYPYGRIYNNARSYAIWPKSLDSSWTKERTIVYSDYGLNLWNAAGYQLTGASIGELFYDCSNILYQAADTYQITAEYYHKGSEYRVLLKGFDSGTQRAINNRAGLLHTCNKGGGTHRLKIDMDHYGSGTIWYLWINQYGEKRMTFAENKKDFNEIRLRNGSTKLVRYKIGGYGQTANAEVNVSDSTTSLLETQKMFSKYQDLLKRVANF